MAYQGPFCRALDAQDAILLAAIADRHFLEVAYDLRHILAHPGKRRKLVMHTFDIDLLDRGPLDKGQQYAAQCVPYRDAKTALKRLDNKHAIRLAEAFFFYLG